MRLGVTHPGRRVPDVEVRCNAPRKKGTRRYIMLLPREKGVTHLGRRVPDVEVRCNALHPLPVPAARSRCSSPLPVAARGRRPWQALANEREAAPTRAHVLRRAHGMFFRTCIVVVTFTVLRR